MDIVNYLTDIYGYDTPIFVNDVKIGGKSKTAIREEIYRASKKGRLIRKGCGVYFIKSDKEFGSGLLFEDIIEKKYIYDKRATEYTKDLLIVGYYSGLTFLNQIGLSNQVPAILEVTTNNTSSKKREYKLGNRTAIVRKAKTKVTFQNYKTLQFLDMFYFLSVEEVSKYKKEIVSYAKKNGITKNEINKYLGLYGGKTIKKIVEGGILNEYIGGQKPI